MFFTLYKGGNWPKYIPMNKIEEQESYQSVGFLVDLTTERGVLARNLGVFARAFGVLTGNLEAVLGVSASAFGDLLPALGVFGDLASNLGDFEALGESLDLFGERFDFSGVAPEPVLGEDR